MGHYSRNAQSVLEMCALGWCEVQMSMINSPPAFDALPENTLLNIHVHTIVV